MLGIRRLKLACGLREFPAEIFDLADTLEILDLSGNNLSSLPDDLPRLTKLRIIFCSDNKFDELPEVLGRCPNLSMIGFRSNRIRTVSPRALPKKLRWLILTDNLIEELPFAMGNCGQLQKLMLAGNRLRALPASLAHCQQLELLRIAANRLTELPAWLLHLPRLAWLAYAGNPFCATLEARALQDSPIGTIHWRELEMQDLLGEGTSGTIHRAEQRIAENHSRHVAVKLFKGALTSDGLPHCELAACISVGQHPNLIPVLGKINGHPAESQGLLMELIGSEFTTLAEPPSLDSCTRDIYSPTARFALAPMLRIAHGMASAARHLHRQGVVHGDLYGHNILYSLQGRALLGDFGAASFYATDDRITADALQRLEARAFGYLLEELIERCDALVASKSGANTLNALNALKTACLNEKNELRPRFEEIEAELSALL